MIDAGALYRCRVMHSRLQGPAYRFEYNLAYLLIDIDRLQDITKKLRFLSHDHFNLFSVYNRDFGPRNGSALRPWVIRLLADHGVNDFSPGRIRLLCIPRLLGYVFNPISIYYCEDCSGCLRAVICEVHNTYGQQHSYVIRLSNSDDKKAGRLEKSKCFHVSPLFDRSGTYRFRFSVPDNNLSVSIQLYHDAKTPSLVTALTGKLNPLTDTKLVLCFLRFPMMTLKVMAAIHWQALKIWLRGARFHTLPRQRQPDNS